MKNRERRRLDAELAVKWFGWTYREVDIQTDRPLVTRKMFNPPADSEMWTWATIWDEDGIPHYLPNYSRGKNGEANEELLKQIESQGFIVTRNGNSVEIHNPKTKQVYPASAESQDLALALAALKVQ